MSTDDGVLQGTFTYWRHGIKETESMGADTALWILRNGAGVVVEGPDGDFVSKAGTTLWWNGETESWWSKFDEDNSAHPKNEGML